MHVLFESQRLLTRVEGRVHFVQTTARLDAAPVFFPNRAVDGNMAQVKTVLPDKGVYRMWYLCAPEFAVAGEKRGKYRTAYAESDDGLTWRRPDLGLVKDGPARNNYVNLNVSSVFIDPLAPPSARYRGTVYAPHPVGVDDDPQGLSDGFFTAHSPDGLFWELDTRDARWHSGDTITGIWHPDWARGIAAMKFTRFFGGMHRRAIWTAELKDGEWGEAVCALAPDEFDDVAAKARGFNSGDYYKMGFLPAGAGMVGLIENFRHWLPLSGSPQHYAIYGMSDVTLAFQAGPGERWLHTPGRRNFIGDERPDWARGWLSTANSPVVAGDEHWLFVTGDQFSHAWEFNSDWQIDAKLRAARTASGELRAVGIARWPRWRMFGFKAAPTGALELELGVFDRPFELILNHETGRQGSVRVQLFTRAARNDKTAMPGRGDLAECVPLRGNALDGVAAWRDGTHIDPAPDRKIVARVTLEDASLYAWDCRRL